MKKQVKKQGLKDKLSTFELRVVELVNLERKKLSLKPLKVDVSLSKVARKKSKDMIINKYFSHHSPVYGSPFNMMRKYGIVYHCAGENIASGYPTPEGVLWGWMNSKGHRKNILSPNYTHIGVGYHYTCSGNYNHFWTQQFIGCPIMNPKQSQSK